MKLKVFFCLVLTLNGILFGCSQLKQPVPADLNFSSISQNIEQRIPQLKSIQTAQLPLSWKCEKQVNVAFFLKKNPRHRPAGELPREPATPTPYADIFVTIARFRSADDALKDLAKSLRQRQVAFQSEPYHAGGTLHRYRDSTGGTQDAIYQSREYIIEIQCYSESAETLTMKALDTVLTELHSYSLGTVRCQNLLSYVDRLSANLSLLTSAATEIEMVLERL